MNHPLELRLDKAAFHRWVVAQEGRYELENGRVQQMTGATKAHARIVTNFMFELGGRLDRDVWSVTACDVAVEIGENVRYPDIVVERLDAVGTPLVAERACLLVEVLSPSSVGRDLRIKAREYTTLADLHTYIVASQDEPQLWVWLRSTGADRAFLAEPLEVAGRDGTISIGPLAITLGLSNLYRGIGNS
jgi:Uma2 family endonuclease